MSKYQLLACVIIMMQFNLPFSLSYPQEKKKENVSLQTCSVLVKFLKTLFPLLDNQFDLYLQCSN